jgi:calcium-dependent protein kinase
MGCCQDTLSAELGEKRLEALAVPSPKPLAKESSPQEVKIQARSFMQHSKDDLSQIYQRGKKLGDGAFGVVYSAVHKVSGDIRAIKSIAKGKLTKNQTESILNEIRILQSLDHPNILKIVEVVEDDTNFHLVSELCTGGELFDRIIEQHSFSEEIAATYMGQLLSAVAYCHGHNIVHRDLKPENLLLENSSPNALLKVIDFGTSCKLNPGDSMKSITGTVTLTQPYYIAPEILTDRQYDQKCDIWSCGVILYVLLCIV